MKIVAEPGLAIGWIVSGIRPPQLSATFIAKLACKLKHGAAATREEKPEQLSGDRHDEDDPAKSLLYASDFAPLKPRADVLVQATAHVPGQQRVPKLTAQIQTGSLNKTLTVFGPRTWQRGRLGGTSPSEPGTFDRVPITYQNAYGGPKSKKNPVGRGIESDDLPQVEDPRLLVKSPSDDVNPAGFGPWAPTWQLRTNLVGTYDQQWLKERWPWFPADFDYGYFNSAPLDQQVEGYLKGDEELVFGNLHPEHSTYRSRLPALRARCYVEERGTDGQLQFR